MPADNEQVGDRVDVDGHYHALADPALDRIFSVTMALAAEVWTVRDRLRLVESALAGQGLALEQLIDSTLRAPAQIEQMSIDRDAFIERVLGTLVPGRSSVPG